MLVSRPVYVSGPGEVAGRNPLAGAAVMLLAVALAVSLLAGGNAYDAGGSPEQSAADGYANLPLSFVPNRGQVDAEARFYAQGSGFSFFFARDRAVLALAKGKRGQALELSFLGANPHARIVAGERAPGRVNHLTGPRSAHHASLPTYHELAYRDLWPGIDLVFRGTGGRLKYEFLVDPGANPSDIRLAWGGATGLATDEAGRLLIGTPLGRLTDARPRSHQRVNGRRVPVESSFAIGTSRGGTPAYGFALGRYDHRAPLVIDPSISYSTFLGGAYQDYGMAIALDINGSAYVTGSAYSADFPTTPGVYDSGMEGYGDAFVTKLTPDGSALVYSTYLGGSYEGETESGDAVAVDGQGNAYVGGYTNSDDFPTTPGAYDDTGSQGAGNSGDSFVTKLSPDGSALIYSTFLGGNSGPEHLRDLALDIDGNAYVVGLTGSYDFPATPGAFATAMAVGEEGYGFDAFVTKLSSDGSSLAYSTYLGGTAHDSGSGIAVDADGSAYVGGLTYSADFPTTPSAFDPSFNSPDSEDAFVTKLDPSGSALEYSTFVGGWGSDVGWALGLDEEGRAYLTGNTYSANFPTTPGAYETTLGSGVFVTRLTSDGSALSYSTFLGGGSSGCCVSSGGGIAVDGEGSAYVTGQTFGSFPTTAGAHDTSANSGYDAFLSRLSTDGSALVYSSYIGGASDDQGNDVAVDSAGAAYVTGHTISLDFPTTDGAYDRSRNGFYPDSSPDAFVTKLITSGPELVTGRLIVKKDAQPDLAEDFAFTAGGGLSPSSFQLDDDPSDSTLSNRKVFESVPPGSGYSVSESTTGGWELTSATCEDGSPPSNIDISPAEIVVCTFVNQFLAGYARPKSAPFANVRLVPAFEECSSGNGEHGAPLAVPSCNPPIQSSTYLTFNAPDRAAPHNSAAVGAGDLRFKLFCTDGSAPPCGLGLQDVNFDGSVTGVRCRGASGGCPAAGAFYSGKLLFEIPLRITDRQNGPSENLAGTLLESAFTFRPGVVCTDGNCNLDTSAEAVYPADVVKEGKRAIWQLGQMRVLDGGEDGDLDAPPDCPPTCFPNDNESAFLEQGLYVP